MSFSQVSLKLRNAPTKLMEELGYGKDYDFDEVSSALQKMIRRSVVKERAELIK